MSQENENRCDCTEWVLCKYCEDFHSKRIAQEIADDIDKEIFYKILNNPELIGAKKNEGK